MNVLYDTIGKGYANYRRPDPRIARRINDALGSAKDIVNVGAGAGSYEPRGRQTIAVELSPQMIGQRPADAAPVVGASALALPFGDNSFDAALAVLTVHHWQDQVAGLREMMRVARQSCVVVSWTVPQTPFWLTQDYFPEILARDRLLFDMEPFHQAFGAFESMIIPIPHDCTDGFLCAYWRRPQMYFDAGARRAISSFSYLGDVSDRLARLKRDLADGSWAQKNAHILDKADVDFGYRIFVAHKRVTQGERHA